MPGRCLDKHGWLVTSLIKGRLPEENVLHPLSHWRRRQVITLLLAGKEASLKYTQAWQRNRTEPNTEGQYRCQPHPTSPLERGATVIANKTQELHSNAGHIYRLTQRVCMVPRLASSALTVCEFLASSDATRCATCNLALPSGGSRRPNVVLIGE